MEDSNAAAMPTSGDLVEGAGTLLSELLVIPTIWQYPIDHWKYVSDLALSGLQKCLTLPIVTFAALKWTSNYRCSGP